MPLLLWLSSSHYNFMPFKSFNQFQIVPCVEDILIFSKIWHWVVNIVSKTTMFVSVLIATCWGADWVRFKVHLLISLQVFDDPLVVKFSLGISKIFTGGNHIWIKMWSEVIHGVLSNIMPLLFWLSSSHDELVVQVQLNASKVLLSIFDFLINSEVWHSVINWVSKTCFFVSVLITTSWWADWVRFSVDISISLGKWFSWNRSREVIVLINFPFMFEGRFLCCSVL